MTAHGPVAMAHWRRLDREGTDRCTLARADGGWMLTGQAAWTDQGEAVSLTYAVRCGEDWETLSADVTGTWGTREVNLCIARDGQRWTMNGAHQTGVDGCTDIDLSFTPATNLLPLRRLNYSGSVPVAVEAAWLVPDLGGLARLEQAYAMAGPGEADYASLNFKARLSVHPTGFVTNYPGLWEGWVDE